MDEENSNIPEGTVSENSSRMPKKRSLKELIEIATSRAVLYVLHEQKQPVSAEEVVRALESHMYPDLENSLEPDKLKITREAALKTLVMGGNDERHALLYWVEKGYVTQSDQGYQITEIGHDFFSNKSQGFISNTIDFLCDQFPLHYSEIKHEIVKKPTPSQIPKSAPIPHRQKIIPTIVKIPEKIVDANQAFRQNIASWQDEQEDLSKYSDSSELLRIRRQEEEAATLKRAKDPAILKAASAKLIILPEEPIVSEPPNISKESVVSNEIPAPAESVSSSIIADNVSPESKTTGVVQDHTQIIPEPHVSEVASVSNPIIGRSDKSNALGTGFKSQKQPLEVRVMMERSPIVRQARIDAILQVLMDETVENPSSDLVSKLPGLREQLDKINLAGLKREYEEKANEARERIETLQKHFATLGLSSPPSEISEPKLSYIATENSPPLGGR